MSMLQGVVLIQIGIALTLWTISSLFLIRATHVDFNAQIAQRSAFWSALVGALFLCMLYNFVLKRLLLNDSATNQNMMNSFIACLVAFLTLPFLLALSRHASLTQFSSTSRARVNTISQWINEYSNRAPLRKLYDFAAFSALSQLLAFSAFHLVNTLLGNTNVKLPFLRNNVWIESVGALWCLGAALFLAFLHSFVVWRFPADATHKINYHTTLRSFRCACGLLVICSSVIYGGSLIASLPTRHAVSQKFDAYLKHDGLWLATGQNSAQWIAKLK